MEKSPLIIITGPTASGKTSLAIELAKMYNGEIISADSRAIYRGINIASAKPSIKERSGIVHWGFDLVNPGDSFTAYDFKKYAYEAIDDISERGKIPFLVGGTGLYIDAVLYDYDFGPKINYELREKLNKMQLEELYKYCKNHNVTLPDNFKNKRYVIRSIEKSASNNYIESSKKYNKYNNIVVGITTDREELKRRIQKRSNQFIEQGILEEAKTMAKEYGWGSEAMTANAYPVAKEYIEGTISESDFVDKITTLDWRLAKRQMTFMKRNRDIIWKDLNGAKTFLINELKNI